MKQNKLSALEKLEIKRAYLKAEEQSHLDELGKHIDYLQDNWGSLLFNSGIDAVKSRTLPLVQNLLGNKNVNLCPSKALGFAEKYPHISTAVGQLVDILPVFLKGKSLIFAIVLKNIKDFLCR